MEGDAQDKEDEQVEEQIGDWVTPSAIQLLHAQGRRKGADQLTILNPATLSLVGETQTATETGQICVGNVSVHDS